MKLLRCFLDHDNTAAYFAIKAFSETDASEGPSRCIPGGTSRHDLDQNQVNEDLLAFIRK